MLSSYTESQKVGEEKIVDGEEELVDSEEKKDLKPSYASVLKSNKPASAAIPLSKPVPQPQSKPKPGDDVVSIADLLNTRLIRNYLIHDKHHKVSFIISIYISPSLNYTIICIIVEKFEYLLHILITTFLSLDA